MPDEIVLRMPEQRAPGAGRPPEKLRKKRHRAANKMLNEILKRVEALETMSREESRQYMTTETLVQAVSKFAPPDASETGEAPPMLVFNAGSRVAVIGTVNPEVLPSPDFAGSEDATLEVLGDVSELD